MFNNLRLKPKGCITFLDMLTFNDRTFEDIDLTRMHSSGMCTIHCSGHLGGVCPGEVCLGVFAQVGVCPGVFAYGVFAKGVYVQGGVCLGGCLSKKGVCLGGVHPLWTEFLAHACENITFLQLLLRTVINV